ncbi:MAG: BACON domain-containing protein [Bacteroidaceae bacterium]|nr:BACON domain-containing protein [Bacteroidaceae bacterium]
MKTIRFLNFCLSMAIYFCSFSACSDDDPEETVRPPYMYAEQTLYEIDAASQVINVHLNTNIDKLDLWIQDKYSWIQLADMKEGENVKNYQFQVADNTTGELRECGIVIIDPENRIAAVTITIRQSVVE